MGGTIFNRELGQCPHHTDLQVDTGNAYRVDNIILMQDLCFFAGVYLNTGTAADAVVAAMG